MGTPAAAVPSLERIHRSGHEIAAVYTQPDRPAGRGNKVGHSPVKTCALENGFKTFQPGEIKSGRAIEQLRAFDADVAVVVAYGRILPEPFLKAFPFGAVNVHFSLLPKYRGAAPVNWAIANGEKTTGVTTMLMDAGLDTGPILSQSSTPIGGDETAIELTQRLAVSGAELLVETLRDWDRIQPVLQDHDMASFAPILKREDGLIDWDMSARNIANRVRGFQPFPTAFTSTGGLKLKLWRASALSQVANESAGTVIEARGDQLRVVCGSGSVLKIDELQPEGKRRMSTRDFLNGFRLEAGSVLGIKE